MRALREHVIPLHNSKKGRMSRHMPGQSLKVIERILQTLSHRNCDESEKLRLSDAFRFSEIDNRIFSPSEDRRSSLRDDRDTSGKSSET